MVADVRTLAFCGWGALHTASADPWPVALEVAKEVDADEDAYKKFACWSSSFPSPRTESLTN
eukprot:1169356-Amphidinium_carterae.1